MIKKILKWLFIIGIILIGIVAIFLFSINESLPDGAEGKEADDLAVRILQNLNYSQFKKTKTIKWSFPGGHHYTWYKSKGTVLVNWNGNQVLLNLVSPEKSEIIKPATGLNASDKTALINTATKFFNNDSFWLVAPYKLFDNGVSRKMVTLENGDQALLVTYKSGGSTPGDSYLWILDKNMRPKSFKMWVSIIPVGGLEATWENWKTTKSGAVLSQKHKILFLDLKIEDITTYN